MKHVKGDLLKLASEGHFNIVVQGCNCFCRMKSGIAKQIAAEYPKAVEADDRTVVGDRNKVGTYSVMLGLRFNIINAYTQFDTNKEGDFRDRFEYEGFQRILDKLAEEYTHCSFGFPYIGMGLAGGDKTRIIAMLENFSKVIEEKSNGIGSVTLVEFAP